MTRPTLCLIGAGRAGGSLARQWHLTQRGFIVTGICTRSGNTALAAALSAPEYQHPEDLPSSDAILIATGDQAIPGVVAQLLKRPTSDWQGKLVFHLSGALGSSELAALKSHGARIASAHPVRAFSHDRTSLADTWIGTEGDTSALANIEQAFQAIGGRCFRINSEHKTEYHAAAVIASNHLIALAHASGQLWDKSGVPPEIAAELYDSLTRGVLDNLKTQSPANALTGPIARGDTDTVEKHQRSLDQGPRATARLYRQLSQYLSELLHKAERAD